MTVATYPPGSTLADWSVQYPIASDPATMYVLATIDAFAVYSGNPFG